jgi:hypothetical protein
LKLKHGKEIETHDNTNEDSETLLVKLKEAKLLLQQYDDEIEKAIEVSLMNKGFNIIRKRILRKQTRLKITKWFLLRRRSVK